MPQWLPYVKFGNGHDGSPAVSGTINSYATVTGTAGSATVTTALSVSVGDLVLLHQSQHASNAGKWELVYVVATGTGSFTAAEPLDNTYAAGAQAVLVPQYTGGTLSGNVSCGAWDGSKGGINIAMFNSPIIISGNISANALGFRGGAGALGSAGNTNYGYQGESYTGTQAESTSANNSGGGAGARNRGLNGGGGGGGGGHATAGGNGTDEQGTGGTGGGTVGSADLSIILFGGGGGGSPRLTDAGNAAAGGNGAGINMIFAPKITITGSVVANGANGSATGGNPDASGSGGGAGGSNLFVSQEPILGTNKATASGGTGGQSIPGGQYDIGGDGGNGGDGRIRANYYSSVSGTTTPTLSSAQDTNLKSQIYSSMI
jgi:hypothetical protein